MMVKVKICGVTSASDARMAALAGADALGFNFVRSSPRYIDPDMARAIIESIPPFVSSVGVFVDSHPEKVREIADRCSLDYVQLHGNEGPQTIQKLSDLKVLNATRVGGEEDIKGLDSHHIRAHLLDARVAGQAGGTGQTFDWSLARRAVGRGQTVILAGGLNPDNVEEAIRSARPFGVDTASGVEKEPGRKSRDLVEEFIEKAKSVRL